MRRNCFKQRNHICSSIEIMNIKLFQRIQSIYSQIYNFKVVLQLGYFYDAFQYVIKIAINRAYLPITIKILILESMIETNKTAPINLRAPELTQDNLISVITKAQPYRKGGIRLEHQQIKGKHLFHNYGHGSSGISLAYASAFMSVKSIYSYLNVDHPIECAVIGSGLIALLSALEIVKSGHLATIYSDKFAQYGQNDISKKLSSQVDQGLWMPFGYDMTDKLRHQLLCKVSYDYYRECLKTSRYQSFKVATVYERDATIQQLKQRIPGFLYNGYKPATLQFGNGSTEQYIKMRTIKIDTQLLMEQLRVEATLRGIKFIQKKFNNQDEILGLKEQCIFNCTGQAAKHLFNDQNMTSVTDHYVIFKNPHKLDYTLSLNLKDNLHMRLHCFGDKIILRSQTPVDAPSQQFVKKLIKQAQNFFENKSIKAKL